jgi:retinol dehydrogenase-12
MPFITLFL